MHMARGRNITVEQGLAQAERRIHEFAKGNILILDLSYLRLPKIPDALRHVQWAQYIDLTGNNLVELPTWIGDLRDLKVLDISHNDLTALPEEIGGLRKLQILAIRQNKLTELPTSLAQLLQLVELYVSTNNLKSLPASLQELPELQILDVRSNEHLQLPHELVAGSDARRILDFYFRVQPGASAAEHVAPQALNEFKLILVGRGLVGKTTLVHKLVTDEFGRFERTPGINITKWPLKIDGDDVRAHLWDFGGQEIMHGTHRFFMTERALYLVFVSGREDTEDHDADYWLSLVRSFAGDVPVIVLLNKWDDYHFELNRELLREKYGKDIVFLETDSQTGTGIRELREKICQLASKLPGLKAVWPSEWRRVKEELPEQKKSWLTFDDFREFCSKRSITKAKDQEALAESLHDLGLMLSFRKDEPLRDFGVLNPEWITKGIYQILNSETLRKAQGKFAAARFADSLPTHDYPPAVHSYLLALMRKFRLCHPLDDKGDQYLIPELLSKEEPNLEAEFPREQCLGFAYRYEAVLPEGLMPRFIVETYVHREPRLAWRTGVVLERANSRALVRGDVQGRTVTIRVAGTGQGRRELLGIIREHFERIHRSFEKLPVTELVPIPQHPDVVVPYNDLLDYEAAGDDEYKVVIDRRPVKVSVTKLLDGVDIPGVRRPADRSVPFHREFLRDRDSVTLFISYSHKDERYRDELRGALTAYERRGDVTSWDDTCIMPGQKWEQEILDKLERADIVVLLLSNDFISSEYCYVKEMKRAFEKAAAGENAVIPIVVRSCAFNKLELGEIQAILPGGKPINKHRDRDGAWLHVTNQLDPVIAFLKSSKLGEARVH
jgi:internalin A